MDGHNLAPVFQVSSATVMTVLPGLMMTTLPNATSQAIGGLFGSVFCICHVLNARMFGTKVQVMAATG